MGFVQIVEYTSSKFGEIEEVLDEWRAATEGKRSTARAVIGEDRERPGHYYTIVEFPSYDEAMRNSGLPETAAMADKMTKLCDGPPTFHNVNVTRVEES